MIRRAVVKPAHISAGGQSAVRQMWEGGPLRRWSSAKSPQTPMGYATGFVGSYVCGLCHEPSEGVYRLREPHKWVCGPCKRKLECSGGARR